MAADICRHCSTPIEHEAENQVWAHSTGTRYLCWEDADYAEPAGSAIGAWSYERT